MRLEKSMIRCPVSRPDRLFHTCNPLNKLVSVRCSHLLERLCFVYVKCTARNVQEEDGDCYQHCSYWAYSQYQQKKRRKQLHSMLHQHHLHTLLHAVNRLIIDLLYSQMHRMLWSGARRRRSGQCFDSDIYIRR